MKPLCLNFDVNAISDHRKRKPSARQATPHTTRDFSGAVDFNGNSRSWIVEPIKHRSRKRAFPFCSARHPIQALQHHGQSGGVDHFTSAINFKPHGDSGQLRIDRTSTTIPRIVSVEAVLKLIHHEFTDNPCCFDRVSG